jgi:hypothetical protein
MDVCASLWWSIKYLISLSPPGQSTNFANFFFRSETAPTISHQNRHRSPRQINLKIAIRAKVKERQRVLMS